MAVITVRGLAESTKARLRVRAAHNGRSMEAEARAILDEALGHDTELGWGSRMAAIFVDADGPLDVDPRIEELRPAGLE